jgi:type I protein arginine methyltransferase
MGYSIADYQRMYLDLPRHDAYVQALTKSITPGDVVTEIGTGFGIYAILAAKLGASKVYAIEANELVRLGPALAEANGVGDKIEFFEMMSTDFVPPQLADVLFADMRGTTPLYANNVESMHDAVERLLKPGGISIPSHDVIEAAVIKLPASCPTAFAAWDENPMGMNLQSIKEIDLGGMRSDRVEPDDLISTSHVVHTARFGVDLVGEFDTRWTTTATATGAAAGFAVWFTGHLVDEICVGPAPHRPPTVYGGATLLFQEPLELHEGDSLECHIRAQNTGSGLQWFWDVSNVAVNVPSRRVNSTMVGTPITPTTLRLLNHSRTVPVTERLRADNFILEKLIAGASVGETTTALWSAFPTLGSIQAARAQVIATANRYDTLGKI